MRKFIALFSVLAASLMIGIVPAGAITNGEPDGEGHPYVGLMVAQTADGAPLFRCSGTLVSPTHFLTAGHCTADEPGLDVARVEIWFDSGFPTPIPLGAGFPAPGPNPCAGVTGYPCTGDVSGEPFAHPEYDPNAFFLHDLGVVVLDEPVERDTYGALPFEGQLSTLPKHASLTAVGYGLQRSFPPPASWKTEALRIRMVAHPRLMGLDNKQVGDYAILLSHDASRGGTCFGDSGGPVFIGDSNVVGAVTSFGTTFTCKGHNGAYRVDQPDDLLFLASFGLTPGA